jgi:RNA polymerase sigma-70 factor (ECF subfamily)
LIPACTFYDRPGPVDWSGIIPRPAPQICLPRAPSGTHDEPMAREGTELIQRMAGGDRDAFGAFYDRYASLAFGVVRRIVRDAGAAEDVLQEVFWELWQAASEYDPGRGTPEAWVIMRARSRGIDRARSVRRRSDMVRTGLDEATTTGGAVDAENPGVRAEQRGLVRGALGQLPENQREVIELAYFDGFTQTEIAERTKQPLGTVKTRMRLGLERLRSLVGSQR